VVSSLLSKLLPTEKEEVAVADISHMANILCTELTLRRYTQQSRVGPASSSNSNSNSNSLVSNSDSHTLALEHLSIPAAVIQSEESRSLSCQFRSVLRHRMSWVLTSIIR
jgi:hypothetical protein